MEVLFIQQEEFPEGDQGEGKGLPEPETRVGVRNVVRVPWGALRATAPRCLHALSVGG